LTEPYHDRNALDHSLDVDLDRLADIAEFLDLDPPNKETCVRVDRPTCGDVITVELHRSDDGRSTDSTRTGVLSYLHPIIPHLSVLLVIRLSTTIVAKEQQVLDSPSDINDSHSSSRVSTGTSASALLNDQTLDFRFGSKR
jgi:hypothetical protein